MFLAKNIPHNGYTAWVNRLFKISETFLDNFETQNNTGLNFFEKKILPDSE
jgi:hypothetical protein